MGQDVTTLTLLTFYKVNTFYFSEQSYRNITKILHTQFLLLTSYVRMVHLLKSVNPSIDILL